MSFVVDPSAYQQKGGGRPNVRDGKKLLWLCGLKYGTSMAGNTKIQVCYVVVEDPDGGQDVNALVWDTFTLTDRAAWKLQQYAHALKLQSSWDALDQEETWEALQKRPVWGTVATEPKRNGEGTMGRVERYSPWGGEVDDKHESAVTEAEAWYRNWVKKGSSSASSNSSSGYSSTGAPDDIPF
jgi:hypothetical protein